jgi:hypothetical protein
MSLLPVLALLIGLLGFATHWSAFRLAEYGLAIVAQVLAALAWWEARGGPIAVVWSCPYCSGELGDRLAVQVHIERDHRPHGKGVMR